ncbi:MAG: hypothetical protein FWB77_03435 [Treponema sp.]|nr:hypothetical protein [Treponema sp.]
MIVKIDSQKADIKLPAKAQPSAQAGKSSASAPVNVPRSAAQLVSAAGLPSDKLSVSIISFARFFSLPLKPQVLADIRRQAFLQPAPLSQSAAQSTSQAASQTAAAQPNTNLSSAQLSLANQSAAGAKTREALSLSAAAAESKGVELTGKGLESYNEAVDPDSRRHDGERQRREREKNEKDEKQVLKSGEITAQSVKEKVFEYMEQNPLLEILNRLPGKNGQRWIVLPFDFTEDGKLYKVSMRVLLNDEKISNGAACLALDISSENNRRLFVMESAGGKPAKVFVYYQPELPPKAHHQFKNELAKQLNVPIEHIFIKTSEESFPFESSFGGEPIAINEAV